MQKSFHQKLSQCRKHLSEWRKHPKIPRPTARKTNYHTKGLPLASLAVVTVLLANLFLNLIPQVTMVSAASCNDVEFIFARGSGEQVATDEDPVGGPSYQQWRKWNEDALYEYNKRLKFSFYDLGAKSYGGHQYPAVPVTESFGGLLNLIGAAISAGEGFAFGDSVNEGVEELKAHIEEISRGCPNTKFVLGGFSQGAMVVSKSLSQLDSDKIIYAATFGDPKIYLPEGNSHKGIFSKIPDACKGLNFSNYRVYVPDCYAYEGALGSYRPYQPDGYWNKLGTWCNNKDIMCSSGWNVADHVDYINGHFYEQASRIIRDRIEETFANSSTGTPSTPSTPSDPSDPPSNHDVVFLFDVSGSMQKLFDIYKAQAKELISKILGAGGRTSLYAYKEFVRHNWPNRRCDFSCDATEMEKAMNRFILSGGGDDDEGLLSALKVVLDETDWAEGATKSIVVLTDAGFHNPDDDGSTVQSIVQRTLEIDPVNIYILSADQESEYEELTRLTNGAYFDVATEAELSTKLISERPSAKLKELEMYGIVGDTLEFDASDSRSQYGEELTYEWDLTGDGQFESINNSAKVRKTFNTEFDGFIQVKVSDSHGSNTMSVKVKVSRSPEVPVKISNLEVANPNSTTQNITFDTDGFKTLVVLEDAPMGFIEADDDSGYFSVTDVTQPTHLTLIPYSDSGYRGEKTEVILQPSPETNPDQPKEPTTPKPTEPTIPSQPVDPSKPARPSQPTNPGSDSVNPLPNLPVPGKPTVADNNSVNVNTPKPVVSVLTKKPDYSSIPSAPSAGTCY